MAGNITDYVDTHVVLGEFHIGLPRDKARAVGRRWTLQIGHRKSRAPRLRVILKKDTAKAEPSGAKPSKSEGPKPGKAENADCLEVWRSPYFGVHRTRAKLTNVEKVLARRYASEWLRRRLDVLRCLSNTGEPCTSYVVRLCCNRRMRKLLNTYLYYLATPSSLER